MGNTQFKPVVGYIRRISGNPVTALSGVGYFIDGYVINSIAVFTYLLGTRHVMAYNAFTLSFVTGSALLGAVVGAIMFGMVSDRFGRDRIYSLYPLLFAVFSYLSAVSVNITEIIVFRFLLGLGVGADYALGPVYAMETDRTRKHGNSYGWVWVMWSVGACVSFLTGFIMVDRVGVSAWRWVFGIIAIPAIPLSLARYAMIKSKTGLKSAPEENYHTDTGAETRKEPLIEVSQNNVKRVPFRRLFSGDYAIRTVIIWIQWILYDIVDYGVALYAPLIVSDLGVKGSYSLLIAALFYVPASLGSVGAAYWNDKIGRRILQISGFSGMGIGIVLITMSVAYFGTLFISVGLLGLLIFYGMGSIGPGNTTGLYAIELLPKELRSTSMGFATAITRLTAFVSAFEFPYIALALSRIVFFEILFAITVGALLFTVLFTPETKGLSLEDISNSRYRKRRLIVKNR